MPYFAELNGDNEVIRVIVADIIQWCQTRLGGRWLTTSYNATVRKNYAGIGYQYRQDIDAFVPPQPVYNFDLNTNTAKWEFSLDTSVIYMLVAADLAVPLSQQLFALINPGETGMYAGVVPHATRTDVVFLQLRTDDVVPVDLGANPAPLASMLAVYVQLGLLTQAELDGLVSGISAAAGTVISVQSFIPASWQQYVLTRQQALDLGWLQ